MKKRSLKGGSKPKVVRARKGAWTEAKRQAFLTVLAETCNVTLAGETVGMASGSVYRERQINASFRAGWAAALAEGYARLELTMLRRAMDGVVKEVRKADGSIEQVTEYSDRVALQLLRQHKDAAGEAAASAPGDEEEDEAEAEAACKRIMRRIDGVRRRLGLADDSEGEMAPA